MQESWKVFHAVKMNSLLRSLLPGNLLPESFSPGVFPPESFPPRVFLPGVFPPGSFPPGVFPPGSFLPGLLLRRLSASSEMAPAVEVFFSRTTPEAAALPGLLSVSSLLALLS